MSLSVQTVLLLLLGAVVGLAVAFTVNNLEPVREFPGRNRLLWRITSCLTLVPVVVAALMDKGVIGQTRVLCWVAAGAIAMALLYDGGKLVSAVRVAKAKRRDPATDGIANSVGYEPELRIKLLAEMERQVEQRLRSAYGEQTLVNLEMHSAPDDVEGEARTSNVFLVPKAKQYVEKFKDSRVRLSRSETILDTFDDKAIAGNLLILGAPGSGKTTALLKLTKDLLGRAKERGKEIPYIFELSAWPETQPDIASWLMAQLAFEHGIKETVSREWILAGQLLPLLDGLDELATGRRQKCIEKINEFVTGQLGRQVVVCCRTKVYEASAQKLDALNGALRIQPLEISQVQDYFEQINPEIWTALQDEAGLGALLKPIESGDEPALLQIPLFLQILAISYRPGRATSTKSELLDSYIVRRLSSKIRKSDRLLAKKKRLKIEWAYYGYENEPKEKDARHYLSWLARRLNESSSNNYFLIEQIQPSWLLEKSEKIKCKLIYSLLSTLFFAFAILPLIYAWGDTSWSNLLFGIAFSLLGGVILFVIPSGKKIKVTETFRFSNLSESLDIWFKHVWKFIAIDLLASSIVVFLAEILKLEIAEPTDYAAVNILLCSTVIFLIFLLLFVLEVSKATFYVRDTPNQGVFASISNSIRIAVISYPICVLVYSYSNLFIEWRTALWTSLAPGGVLATLGGFIIGGGLPVVQHSTLRFLLYRRGHIPYNYAKFLKYTTERRLTQQIGGRFRFIHRELLDHFAAMDSD